MVILLGTLMHDGVIVTAMHTICACSRVMPSCIRIIKQLVYCSAYASAVQAADISERADVERAWLEYGKYLVWGCFAYFRSRIMVTLQPHLLFYKAARLCHPLRMADLRFSAGTIRTTLTDSTLLEFAPFLKTVDVDQLITELPAYKAAAADLQQADPSFTVNDIMPFWRRQKESGNLNMWLKLVRLIATVQPASAAAERVFSIMGNSFGDKQTRALGDYIGSTCQLQFNGRDH